VEIKKKLSIKLQLFFFECRKLELYENYEKLQIILN